MEKRYSVKDEEFYRKLILPEEERSHYTSVRMGWIVPLVPKPQRRMY